MAKEQKVKKVPSVPKSKDSNRKSRALKDEASWELIDDLAEGRREDVDKSLEHQR